ncbi:SDR family NAD(P)-dependent oxidoreductase [Brevundimonas staleyi]|uniref:SDR family NAD(P)-dependent oxidoreductase n=1 Tax=Brevundimonas staleyi TaxID=74326 RepID=A0ABW0FPD2_9CAUL
MTGSLDGRVVIVTGAGQGLGQAYALDLAARKARVVVNTRPRSDGRPASGEALVEQILASGGQAVACTVALEDEDAGDQLLDSALQAFGAVDALVNNAGPPEAKPLHELAMADVHKCFSVNYFGTLAATLPTYRHMREQGFGRIVMTTSAAGVYSVRTMAAYSSAKAAIIGLTRVIALEGGPQNVHCNAVAPYALTDLSSGYVEDDGAGTMPPGLIAPVVSWLAAPDCPLNGETIVTGAGKICRAVRVQGPGVQFDPPETISPEGISAHLDDTLSLADWTMPAHGIAAYHAFRQTSAPVIVRSSDLP